MKKWRAANGDFTGILATLILCGCVSCFASEKVLHNFDILPHGANPQAGLISDAAGNLYGTAYDSTSFGVVFELSPSSTGRWSENILYTFRGNAISGPDGAYPQGTLVFDSIGNLYGTTTQGGTLGWGTVFKLTPTRKGAWRETVLHSFSDYPADGNYPMGKLVFDKAGNLYGATRYGGTADACGSQYYTESCGTVFELSPTQSGWTEQILHSFQGGDDGCAPGGGVTLDESGNIYGTTFSSGGFGYQCGFGYGTVFLLSPAQDGAWNESVLYAFSGYADGGNPFDAPVTDSSGNLYGTASYSVFELSPGPNGSWTENTLATLPAPSNAGVALDAAGNIYGSTQNGGASGNCYSGCGSVFEVSPGQQGWGLTTIYSLTDGSDGAYPVTPPLLNSSGTLFLPATAGAINGCSYYIYRNVGCGSVLKLTASPQGVWSASTLYDFPSPEDGSNPYGNLISDSAGNLYGTTQFGGVGPCNCGTVYKLSPGPNGTWIRQVLYSFEGSSNGDGSNPVAGLVFDSAGDLYGTTEVGGNDNCFSDEPCGTVFEISPSPGGGWSEEVLYSFGSKPNEGFHPVAGLAIDSTGVLYGTTSQGGDGDEGDIFQLMPTDDGWQPKVLYNFSSLEGGNKAALVLDPLGNLYGVAGAHAFELSRTGDTWSETVLFSFNQRKGSIPFSALVFDRDGNLYGNAGTGGLYNAGVVFELKPGPGGIWTETVLHNFVGVNGDGAEPAAGLIFDRLGNLYGTTTVGGMNGGGCGGLGCGTAFELTPSPHGEWKERMLHRFTGGVDGGQPYSGLIFDSEGSLLGTATTGGAAGEGLVFDITP